MEKTKKRQIEYHAIIKRIYRHPETGPQAFTEIYTLLSDILALPKKDRRYEMKTSKICFLERLSVQKDSEYTYVSGYFESAVYEFRPKLINTVTATTRDNPKEKLEGEVEKTHFCLRICDKIYTKEVILVLEKNANGVNVKQFLNYLTSFNKRFAAEKERKINYYLQNHMLVRDDIEEAIRGMSRARVAELYIDKRLLGSQALDFSNRFAEAKQSMILTVKAEKNASIKDVAMDFLRLLQGTRSEVVKMKLWGIDDDNQNVLIDTAYFGKKTEIVCDLNPDTGEISSAPILLALKELAERL